MIKCYLCATEITNGRMFVTVLEKYVCKPCATMTHESELVRKVADGMRKEAGQKGKNMAVLRRCKKCGYKLTEDTMRICPNCKCESFVEESDVVADSKDGKVESEMDIANRFMYHAPKDGQPAMCVKIRDKAAELAHLINGLAPDSREKAISINKVDEAVMWANASIARNTQGV